MITGALAATARSYFPATWDALAREDVLGDAGLQQAVDLAQFRLFATVATNSAQTSAYNPLQKSYLARMIAYQLIPAGIDYWGDQLLSEQIRGTEESAVYADRRTGLYKIAIRLSAELAKDLVEITGLIQKRRTPGVGVSPGGFVTQDPQDFATIDPLSTSWPLDPFAK